MIPTVVSWTHAVLWFLDALILESHWNHNCSLQFPWSGSVSLFLSCTALPHLLELPTFSSRFWWFLYILHLLGQWNKCLSTFERYRVWLLDCPFLLYSLLSGFSNFGPYFRPHILRSRIVSLSPRPHFSPWRFLIQQSLHSCRRFLFFCENSGLSLAFCLVVHQPYDAGTNTYPGLTLFGENRHSGGCQYSQSDRVQVSFK